MSPVRSATADDARAIAAVHVGAWQVGYREMLPQPVLDALSIDEREETWHGHLTDPANDVRTLVADDEGQIAGFVSIVGHARDEDAKPGTAEIPALYVHPTRWRTGVGLELMLVGLSALRAAGADDVTLWVIAANDRARGFYERCGFAADGAARTGRFGERELRYRLTL